MSLDYWRKVNQADDYANVPEISNEHL